MLKNRINYFRAGTGWQFRMAVSGRKGQAFITIMKSKKVLFLKKGN
uniref:Uncharacterized protein n=1 Tax=Anguilla anguilla TaxID=7936 RepID=A0A0E9WT64_ANGAN